MSKLITMSLLFFYFFAHANAPQSHETEVVPGEFVIELKSRVTTKNLESLGFRVLENVRPTLFLVRVGDAVQMQSRSQRTKNFQALKSLAKIVEPNYIYRANLTPNDPLLSKLWGLTNTGAADSQGLQGIAGIDINAEAAWQYTTGSKNVVVAVIDTGLETIHPDLSGNVWTNAVEAAGLPAVDDDSNGYVDDVHGYDFANNKGDLTDDNGHGSHCSGTIGATGNDGKGLVGVNWDVSLMGVKFLDKDGSGTLANAIKAIDYARKMNVRIMSNSWGGGARSEILKKAIDDARDAGILFVAAAGNDGSDNDLTPSYPASYESDNILAVAAINNRGELADFSNFGLKSVHVAAPGVNIYSSINGGRYAYYSGTSMATPHVSGIAALLASFNTTMTYSELKSRIISTARPLAGLRNRVQSGGLADAYYALTDQKPPDDPNDPTPWPGRQAVSISTPHPYTKKFAQSWTITIPGAKRIALQFKKFETEKGYDILQILDSTGKAIGSRSGTHTGAFGPVVQGDTITLNFAADDTIEKYGFDIDTIYYE